MVINGNGKLEQKTCLIIYNLYSTCQSSFDDLEDESEANERTDVTAVRKTLREIGYTVRTLGIARINSKVLSKIEAVDPDFIFNLCESLYERSILETYIAGLFELLRVPYTGSPPFALALALNKRKIKHSLKSAGIPVPSAIMVLPENEINVDDFNDLTPPYIVKPVREDGSAGITGKSVVSTMEEVVALVKTIHEEYHQPALIEEFIDGREVTVPIVEFDGVPTVLAINEVDFSQMPQGETKIISYNAKWDPKSPLYTGSQIVCPAKNLAPQVKARVEKLAIRAFKEIGCRDYVRIDFRLDEKNRPYIIEINTNADIAPESGFGDAIQVFGKTYKDLIEVIAANTLKRGKIMRKKNATEILDAAIS